MVRVLVVFAAVFSVIFFTLTYLAVTHNAPLLARIKRLFADVAALKARLGPVAGGVGEAEKH